jgi:hypothetical protein
MVYADLAFDFRAYGSLCALRLIKNSGGFAKFFSSRKESRPFAASGTSFWALTAFKTADDRQKLDASRLHYIPSEFRAEDNKKENKIYVFTAITDYAFSGTSPGKSGPCGQPGGEVSSRILQFRILLTCVYRFPDHGDKTKKGRA